MKTSVLPLPVNAIPIMSRPASTAGMPWIWIGVGLRMLLGGEDVDDGSGKRMSGRS